MARNEHSAARGPRRLPNLALLLASGLGLFVGCAAPGRTPSATETVAPSAESGHPVVVLVPGLGRTTWSLRRLGRRLEAEGLEPSYYGYASLSNSIETSMAGLREEILRLERSPDVGTIHLVGHSLGGILIRGALRDPPPAKLGRVVLLAPPNRGSTRARLFSPWVGGLLPAVRQLRAPPSQLVAGLPERIPTDTGIIAGSADTTVTSSQTHLPGETDHLLVRAGHTFIMNDPEVLRQVPYFLLHGRFDRRPESVTAP